MARYGPLRLGAGISAMSLLAAAPQQLKHLKRYSWWSA
jgi:hypothetical protein